MFGSRGLYQNRSSSSCPDKIELKDRAFFRATGRIPETPEEHQTAETLDAISENTAVNDTAFTPEI